MYTITLKISKFFEIFRKVEKIHIFSKLDSKALFMPNHIYDRP